MATLEQQLIEAGAAWRTAQPEIGMPEFRQRRASASRSGLALIGALGAVAVAVAVAIVSLGLRTPFAPSVGASADPTACEAIAPANPKDPHLAEAYEQLMNELMVSGSGLRFGYLNELTGVIELGIANPTAQLCNDLHARFGTFIHVQDTAPSAANTGRADWWVDPAALPLSKDATEIPGFIQERNCASGGSPEGRIVGPTIEYKTDAITVTYKVMAVGGTCPGNPAFAVTVHLSEPFGNRKLLDGGVIPPRNALVDPTIVLAPTEDCGPLVGTTDTKIACLALLNETIGDRYEEFATFEVRPAEGGCAGDECLNAGGIEAHTWTVVAVERAGLSHRWTCAYAAEVATCTVVTE